MRSRRRLLHSPSKFVGDLNESIVIQDPSQRVIPTIAGRPEIANVSVDNWSNEQDEKDGSFILSEQLRKLPLLYKHYNIDPCVENASQLLALRIATEFVPGFQVELARKKGKKISWTTAHELNLWLTVTKRVQLGQSAINACLELRAVSPWKELSTGTDETNLYKAYQRAKAQPLPQFLARLVELDGSQDAWNNVEEIVRLFGRLPRAPYS